MAYHDSAKLAHAAMAEIGKKYPLEWPIANALHNHFTAKEGNPDYPRLHATLMLMLERTPAKAVDRMIQERDLRHDPARGLLIDAVMNGPETWNRDKDYIYGLGFIHAKGRFFQASEGFEKGSAFDKARRAVKEEYQPIVDEAIFLTHTRQIPKIVSMGTVLLAYVPVQLLENKKDREFKMNALAIGNFDPQFSERKYSGRVHQNNIDESARAIKILAALCKITLPPDLLEGDRQISSPAQNELTVEQAKAAKPAPIANDIHTDEDKFEIRRQLAALMKKGQITDVEARVYFWMYTHNDVVTTTSTAASALKNLKKTPQQISDINQKVGSILREQAKQESPSDERHQSREARNVSAGSRKLV